MFCFDISWQYYITYLRSYAIIHICNLLKMEECNINSLRGFYFYYAKRWP